MTNAEKIVENLDFIIKNLSKKIGENLYSIGKYNLTLVHIAAIGGDTEALEDCKRAGLDMEAKDNRGMTPAHLAALNGHTEALKYLESIGANLEAKSNHNMTPAHLATFFGKTETLKYLVEEVGVCLKIINKYGETLLDMAYARSDWEKNQEIINLLIKAGAKTGEELREEEKQKAAFGRAGRPCDDGNNGHSGKKA